MLAPVQLQTTNKSALLMEEKGLKGVGKNDTCKQLDKGNFVHLFVCVRDPLFFNRFFSFWRSMRCQCYSGYG